jgi:hypothetical protein
MEKARIRAVEMIAMAEAVGAQRVAASAESVNKMFDEQHPELAAVHPALDGMGSPRPAAGMQPGSPGSVFQMKNSLPELTDLKSLATRALETVEATSTSNMEAHHGCIVVTIHEAADLKSTSNKPTVAGRRVLSDSGCLSSILRVLADVRRHGGLWQNEPVCNAKCRWRCREENWDPRKSWEDPGLGRGFRFPGYVRRG